jgi:hypothetical protein
MRSEIGKQQEGIAKLLLPSDMNKVAIGKLLPFKMQGDKCEVLADNIGELVESVAKSSARVIDAFAGAGTYTHYLRNAGCDIPIIMNEFDSFRYITHLHLKKNPIAVRRAVNYYTAKLNKKVATFENGERYGPAAETVRKNISSFFQKETERLLEPGQNLHDLYQNSLPVKLINTPGLASLYIVMQNQKFGYRPLQAEASRGGLKTIMPYSKIMTIHKEKQKIKLFRTGKSILFNTRERIPAVSSRMRNVEVLHRDGWKLIYELAGKDDLVLVDTSYLGKKTNNYGKLTKKDCDADVYMKKVCQYLMPAHDRGAKILITNNWDENVVGFLLNLGFTVFKAERAKDQKGGVTELVAVNFDPGTRGFEFCRHG